METTLNENEQFIWLQSGSGVIEILAPLNKVESVAMTGDNMEATKELLNEPLVLNQISYYSSDTLIRFIEDYGSSLSKGEKADRETLLLTTLWLLSWDAVENKENNIATSKDIENIKKLFEGTTFVREVM